MFNRFIPLIYVLLTSLMVCIPSGFFDLHQYFSQRITSNKITAEELEYSHQLGLTESFRYAMNQVEKGSKPWLFYLQKLAKKDLTAAVKLGKYYIAKGNVTQASVWFYFASEKGSSEGSIELAQILINQEKYIDAKAVLQKINKTHMPVEVLVLLIELSIIDGNTSQFKSYYAELITHLNSDSPRNKSISFREGISSGSYFDTKAEKQENLLLSRLNTYKVNQFFEQLSDPHKYIAPSILPENEATTFVSDTCHPVQFIGTTLRGLDHLNKLISQLAMSELSPYFCFYPPKYVSEKVLACNAKSPSALITCDMTQWSIFTEQVRARYVAVMADSGKANVSSGLLLIDQFDNLDVVKHELMHLLGFIDEYPLKLKHAVCETPQFEQISPNVAVLPNDIVTPLNTGKENILSIVKISAANISVLRRQVLSHIPWAELIKPTTPIFTQKGGTWQLGTPESHSNEIGIYHSKTCQGRAVLSVKPTSTLTTLEYFDSELPSAYLELIERYPHKFIMPSFHHKLRTAFK